MLAGGEAPEREGVDAGLEEVGERGLDHALAHKPALPGEGRALDPDREVALARAVVAQVPGVAGAVVHDLEARGRKRRLEPGPHVLLDLAHRALPLYAGTAYSAAMPEKERPSRGGRFPGNRPCAHPGCPEPGEYRAPRARPGSAFLPPAGPPDWQYFCLAHVREFNARWNFFDGMTAEEIWAAQSPDPRWEREVEALARAADPRRREASLDDPLGILRWRAGGSRPRALARADREALAVLGLGEEATLAEVKARYRALARRWHPDSNNGDRQHEAKLQAATEAQARLVASAAFRRRGAAGD